MELIYRNIISVTDYNNLRLAVGWEEISERQAQKGIENSEYLIAVYASGIAVGIARLITDGGYIGYIADVMVRPEYQKQNIGSTKISMIMEYIHTNLEAGEGMFVGLMAAKGKEDFYKRFGFEERPNDNGGAGMTMWISNK
jgi:GNAT superfamily N-acetyltransferase